MRDLENELTRKQKQIENIKYEFKAVMTKQQGVERAWYDMNEGASVGDTKKAQKELKLKK